jgi:hypothetical protein
LAFYFEQRAILDFMALVFGRCTGAGISRSKWFFVVTLPFYALFHARRRGGLLERAFPSKYTVFREKTAVAGFATLSVICLFQI